MLASSAHELQRAAGAVQAHAGDRDLVPTHPTTLAHVEESLDRLAVAMDQMANAVAEWCADDTALPPEARALRWHLQAAARTLRESEAGCTTSRQWARRLLAVAAADEDVAGAADAADPGEH